MKKVGTVTDESYGEYDDYSMLEHLRRCGNIKGYPDAISAQKRRIYLDEYKDN